VLFPQPEMAEDAFYDIGVINEADGFHLMAVPYVASSNQMAEFWQHNQTRDIRPRCCLGVMALDMV